MSSARARPGPQSLERLPRKTPSRKRFDRSQVEAEPTTPMKLSVIVAERILRDIAKGGWEVGAVLGQEAQLMERYDVSRATLREAVRQLECQGVATMRRGFGGGLAVQAPAHRAAIQALANFLELSHVSPKALYEAKEVLEVRAVKMASRQLTDEHVKQLREGIDQIEAAPFDAIEEESRLHARIRRTVADAAGNPALSLFMQGLNRITQKLMPEYSRLAQMTDEHRRERELRGRQVEAVISGDTTAAEQATLEQLTLALKTTEQALRRFRNREKHTPSLERGVPPHVVPWDAQDKLPHRLAAAIALDISEQQQPPGSRVGSEPEFIERFGVSRAVFREAVRLLENYGIVQMRRGFGGGLAVGTRSSSRIIALVATYLGHAKLERKHFLEVLGILYTAAAPLAAERAPKPQALALLARARAIDSNATEGAADSMRNHFRELLAFTGNPALILIGEVAHSLSDFFQMDPPPPELQAKFKQLHCDMVAAVADGDGGLARRMMSRFVASLYQWYGLAEHRRSSIASGALM